MRYTHNYNQRKTDLVQRLEVRMRIAQGFAAGTLVLSAFIIIFSLAARGNAQRFGTLVLLVLGSPLVFCLAFVAAALAANVLAVTKHKNLTNIIDTRTLPIIIFVCVTMDLLIAGAWFYVLAPLMRQ